MTRLLPAAALFLAACAGFPEPAMPPSVLPPVKVYDEAFQAELFDQAAAIPPGSALDRFFADSIALRCAVQAARGDVVGTICAPGD